MAVEIGRCALRAVRAALLVLLAAGSAPASALEPFTEHTYRLADGEAPAAVTLDDVAWLAGNWRGEAFGKTFEAAWNPPSAGSMVGNESMEAFIVFRRADAVSEEKLTYRRVR